MPCWLVAILCLAPLDVIVADTRPNSEIVLNSAFDEPLTTDNSNGVLDKVATEVFRRIGYKLIIKRLPAERGLRDANRGLIDGELGRIGGLNHTYTGLVQVPEKLVDMHFVAFSRKMNVLQSGWQSLSGKNIAFITGWKIFESNSPSSAAVTKTKNASQLFKLLERDRADYVLFNRWAGRHMVKKLKLKDVVELNPPLATREMFIYLNKKHSHLIPQLTEALAKMKADGSYSQHMNSLTESPITP